MHRVAERCQPEARAPHHTTHSPNQATTQHRAPSTHDVAGRGSTGLTHRVLSHAHPGPRSVPSMAAYTRTHVHACARSLLHGVRGRWVCRARINDATTTHRSSSVPGCPSHGMRMHGRHPVPRPSFGRTKCTAHASTLQKQEHHAPASPALARCRRHEDMCCIKPSCLRSSARQLQRNGGPQAAAAPPT